jgi:hypothetical protein
MFDWRQLRRWNLDEARLPSNSVLRYQTLTIWQAYKWYILVGVTALVLQTGLMIGLLVNRAQRRRAEQARRESEERRRLAEEDVQRQREQLAHALRLTTLGDAMPSVRLANRQNVEKGHKPQPLCGLCRLLGRGIAP